MGLGISRPLNMTSCGQFRRTSSEMQDPSNYKRIMVANENQDNAPAVGVVDSKATRPKDVVSSTKDVVNEEKQSTYPDNINIYQQMDEETERISDYDGPMFMKSPSFSVFVRPKDLLDHKVKNNGKGEGEMRENKTEAHEDPVIVCNGEVCVRVEGKKKEMPVDNKEAGPGKEKRIYKIFSQYYKPSAVSGGVKSLFQSNPKQPKQPN